MRASSALKHDQTDPSFRHLFEDFCTWLRDQGQEAWLLHGTPLGSKRLAVGLRGEGRAMSNSARVFEFLGSDRFGFQLTIASSECRFAEALLDGICLCAVFLGQWQFVQAAVDLLERTCGRFSPLGPLINMKLYVSEKIRPSTHTHTPHKLLLKSGEAFDGPQRETLPTFSNKDTAREPEPRN